ncbi:MAG: DNA polymerase III subunit chi [Candidatus Paracaedibacteraceae bacterium]|nr:DNA polymerase III subunit chi [Candidatus Paracaedibacteraceae bacterium]
MEVAFYHLTVTPLEKALPKLVEKIYLNGLRTLIVCDTQERMETLNSVLWTFSPTSFIPHGCVGDPLRHPVWLSLSIDNVNKAEVVIVLNGTMIPDQRFERCMDMFDGNNVDVVQNARERYKAYRDRDLKLAYWKQNDKGAWGQG